MSIPLTDENLEIFFSVYQTLHKRWEEDQYLFNEEEWERINNNPNIDDQKKDIFWRNDRTSREIIGREEVKQNIWRKLSFYLLNSFIPTGVQVDE